MKESVRVWRVETLQGNTKFVGNNTAKVIESFALLCYDLRNLSDFSFSDLPTISQHLQFIPHAEGFFRLKIRLF